MKRTTFALLTIIIIAGCRTLRTNTSSPRVSQTSLLTAKQWIYDTVYGNYTGPGTGTILYARDAVNNTYQLDNFRAVYWADGHIDAWDNSGNYSTFTWTFFNRDSTLLKQIQPIGPSPVYARIIKLDATHYTLYDSTDHTLNIAIAK